MLAVRMVGPPERRCNYIRGQFRWSWLSVVAGPVDMARQQVRSPFGALLRQWRARRGISQLDLAVHAEISTRHLCFVETGKSRPSRQLVLHLGDVLKIPLRERNRLLEAAGYAAAWRETPHDELQMAQAWTTIDFILRQHEPYFCVAIDRYWNVVAANRGADRMLRAFGRSLDCLGDRPVNILHIIFDPRGMRPNFGNWAPVATMFVTRVRQAVAADPDDTRMRELLDRILAYPDVPTSVPGDEGQETSPLAFRLQLRNADLELNLYSAYTMLGKPQDVTLDELLIETAFPADAASDAILRRLAREDADGGTA